MKSKTKTYILLVAVLGIWGTISYKIFSGLNPNTPTTTAQNIDVNFTPKPIKEVDTFSIDIVERDPFLGTLTAKKTKRPKARITPKTKIDSLPQATITYGGMVKEQKSGDQLFVVNVNANQHLLRKGQTADGVTVLRGTTKEVVVRYNKKTQTIAKN